MKRYRVKSQLVVNPEGKILTVFTIQQRRYLFFWRHIWHSFNKEEALENLERCERFKSEII